MSFAIRPILGFLISALMAAPALANNASVTSATSVMQAPKKDGRRWSGFINSSYSTNMIDYEDGTRGESMDYMARFNLKLNNTFTARVQGGYAQDLKDSQNDSFSNTTFSVNRTPFEVGKRLSMNYRVGMVAPTSKDAQKRQNMITALTAGTTFIVNPDYLISGLDITATLGFNRNFHQYETALDGSVNTEYSSNQGLSFAYSFANGISLSADFVHMNTWSYQRVMRDSFDFSQEIGYEINPTFSIAMGHTNSGSTLKPNGTDSNIDLMDEDTSIVYGSVTVVF
ncbi:hypothetical protein ACNH6C_07605 [Bdellovibrio bacteriovorus]|uniref:hypothetical protein n=1 Tax=Bdellovibrio bacteriovorus TaxID=959 RepID=UPI003A8019A0